MMKIREIEVLWSKYEGLLNKLENEKINTFIEQEGQRIISGSFSQRTKEPFCGIGGLVEYSLELAKTASSISKALNYDVSKASIIKCSLLSVIGRAGTLTINRFVDTTSEWHKEKLGQYYDWNDECPKYRIGDMTLYILQHYDISLSWDEWLAISLVSDTTPETTKFYGYNKSRLATVLSIAHETVLKDEVDKIKEHYTIPF